MTFNWVETSFAAVLKSVRFGKDRKKALNAFEDFGIFKIGEIGV